MKAEKGMSVTKSTNIESEATKKYIKQGFKRQFLKDAA